jgi:hypothetical protein
MTNRTHTAARVITIAIALLAVVISYTHIVHFFQGLGLDGWQAYAAPVFIDGFAGLGLLARSASFAPETRKLGAWFQTVATVVSLGANVAAGETLGDQVFGAMVVLGYLAAEFLAERMRPIEAHTAAAATAKRSASAQKAAATRKANAAKAKPATAQARRRVGHLPAGAPALASV